jgi:hypothetical protein
MFAFDIGMSVDLYEFERRMSSNAQRETIRHRRRAPEYFEYRPLPIRVTQEILPFILGHFRSESTVDAVIFDFGAVLVIHSFPIQGMLSELLVLSNDLYGNDTLTRDARQRAEGILDIIRPAVVKPSISDFMEDYVIYEIQEFFGDVPASQLITDHARPLAQILRSESKELSDQEVVDAVSYQLSFNPNDSAIIDWNAAIVYDREAEDLRAVLEFANVELLEMRYLDQQLDDALDKAYRVSSSGSKAYWSSLFGRGSELEYVAQLQVDSAILFEGVNNSLKLLGDQYLARVYHAASRRFHMAEWDASILRKLETIESIYQKLNDRRSGARLEVLEWIIIVLILISIFLPFFPGYH